MAVGRSEVNIPDYVQTAVSHAQDSSSPVVRQAITSARDGAGSPSGTVLAASQSQSSAATKGQLSSDYQRGNLRGRSPISPYLRRALPPVAVEPIFKVATARPRAPIADAGAPVAKAPVAKRPEAETRGPRRMATVTPNAATPKRLAAQGKAPLGLREAQLIASCPWGLDELALWLASDEGRAARCFSGHTISQYSPTEFDSDALFASSQGLHDAIAQFVSRRTGATQSVVPSAEDALRAQVDEALAASEGLFDQAPSVRRALPALFATTVVTAALLLNGTQGQLVGAEFAAAADRGAETSASRNNISAPTTEATVAPPTSATPTPPGTEAAPPAPIVPVAAPAPPPPPPPPPEWVHPTPSAKLTSNFGTRTHPITGKRRLHEGVDYSAPTGTAIRAATSGTVVKAGSEGGYGNYTCIAKDSVYTTCYAHQSKISVRKGQKVTAGQIIGTVGNTGASTGAHLHFEVRKNGASVNPLPFI